ncbi:MAG: MBL fold hydrolase [Rhodospirillaceae bacterium]|nr:MBL fold hydrolase [Rhodospirillaceae bacterium]|tara:strand:- start:330 stop:1358 length:1029 start_codon:yes stop_codon:yes gene_type:complete
MESNVNYIRGDELPSPTEPIEIADGIFWFRMPMPIALDHINIYLLDDGDSWVLVDTGMADPVSIETWAIILNDFLSQRPITKIIGTHFHPDHVGLAGWLLDRTDAELWMSQIEWLCARQAYLDVENGSSLQMQDFYKRTGLESSLIGIYREIGNDYRQMVTPIPPIYKRIEASTTFDIGGRKWLPIFGSGHSPDHVSLYCSDDQLLLGGDMLLPRITPIIAVWWQEPDGDPLAGYLNFLTTLDPTSNQISVLPAHDRPYKGLETRVLDLIKHHQTRLDITFDSCGSRSTAKDIMEALFQRELDPFQTRFAIGETVAHVNNLLLKNEIKRNQNADGIYIYEKL